MSSLYCKLCRLQLPEDPGICDQVTNVTAFHYEQQWGGLEERYPEDYSQKQNLLLGRDIVFLSASPHICSLLIEQRQD